MSNKGILSFEMKQSTATTSLDVQCPTFIASNLIYGIGIQHPINGRAKRIQHLTFGF
jgi:hypothetical protein